MNISFKMFLLVAEELNVSKAAQRAFVTQQCASDHIKRLEEVYGVKLFNRKPKFSLTSAGLVMQEKLRHMQAIEEVMEEQLGEIKGESLGHLSIGINPTRARILLPEALEEYNKNFKKVNSSIMLDDTTNLEEMLLTNKIDMFLGVNTSSNKAFAKRNVGEDKIFLLGTTSFFMENMKISKKFLLTLMKKGISLKKIKGLSVVRNLSDSTLNHVINRHLNKYDVILDTLTYISDYDTQIALCGKGLGIAFCPTLVLQRVLDYNKLLPQNNQILIIPISDLKEKLQIDLVTFGEIPLPNYAKSFANCLCETITFKYDMIKKKVKFR